MCIGVGNGGACPHNQSPAHPVFVALALAMVYHMKFMNKCSYKVCSAYLISYCLLFIGSQSLQPRNTCLPPLGAIYSPYSEKWAWFGSNVGVVKNFT